MNDDSGLSRKCEECGEDHGDGYTELHHKWHEPFKEPWDYPDEAFRLLCHDCHERVHAVEKQTRAWIISQQPHILYEFRVMSALMESKYPKSALAKARRAILNFEMLAK